MIKQWANRRYIYIYILIAVYSLFSLVFLSGNNAHAGEPITLENEILRKNTAAAYIQGCYSEGARGGVAVGGNDGKLDSAVLDRDLFGTFDIITGDGDPDYKADSYFGQPAVGGYYIEKVISGVYTPKSTTMVGGALGMGVPVTQDESTKCKDEKGYEAMRIIDPKITNQESALCEMGYKFDIYPDGAATECIQNTSRERYDGGDKNKDTMVRQSDAEQTLRNFLSKNVTTMSTEAMSYAFCLLYGGMVEQSVDNPNFAGDVYFFDGNVIQKTATYKDSDCLKYLQDKNLAKEWLEKSNPGCKVMNRIVNQHNWDKFPDWEIGEFTFCEGYNVKDNPPASPDDISAASSGTSTAPEETECEKNAAGFSWILCAFHSLMEDSGQSLFQAILDNMLSFNILNKQNNEIKKVWDNLLPVANVVLAIVFLIMIYSLATSTGMSNYTIKKVMPRLVIAAIAINLSFYICAAAVDLSNIIGANVVDFLMGANGNNFPVLSVEDKVLTSFIIIILVVVISIPAVLIGGVIFLALVITRQIMLSVMVMISGLAFALYLLPNTKKWFDMWAKEFSRLLIAYPFVATVFAACLMLNDPLRSSIGQLGFLVTPLLVLVPIITMIPILKMSGNIMSMVSNRVNNAGNASREKYRNTNYAKNRAANREIRKNLAAAGMRNTNGKFGAVNRARNRVTRWKNQAISRIPGSSGYGEQLQASANKTATERADAFAGTLQGEHFKEFMEKGTIKGRKVDDHTKAAAMREAIKTKAYNPEQEAKMFASVRNSMVNSDAIKQLQGDYAGSKQRVLSMGAIYKNGQAAGKQITQDDYNKGVQDFVKDEIYADNWSNISADQAKFVMAQGSSYESHVHNVASQVAAKGDIRSSSSFTASLVSGSGAITNNERNELRVDHSKVYLGDAGAIPSSGNSGSSSTPPPSAANSGSSGSGSSTPPSGYGPSARPTGTP